MLKGFKIKKIIFSKFMVLFLLGIILFVFLLFNYSDRINSLHNFLTNKVFDVTKSLFGADIIYIKDSNYLGATVFLSQKEKEPFVQTTEIEVIEEEPFVQITEVEEEPSVQITETEVIEEVLNDTSDNADNIGITQEVIVEHIEQTIEEYKGKLIPKGTPFYGGGGGGVKTATAIVLDTTAPDSPIIITPADFTSPFSTTTISFSGTAENNSTVQIEYYLNSATTTQDIVADSSGSWSFSDIVFGQGTTTTNFYAIDSSNNKSSATTVSVGVNTSPTAPIITSPITTTFATTTLTFSGTATSTLIISTDYSSATTTADTNNEWSLTLNDFSEGITTISFYSTEGSLVSSATEYQLTIDTTAPAIPTLTITECSNSLSQEVCLSPSTTGNLSFTSTSTDISYYSIVKDGVSIATTTATTSIQTLSNGAYSMEIVAYDNAGNNSTSTSQSITIETMPIVINEIAWSGTASSSADEWIELYNRTSYTINLSDVTIEAGDGAPYIPLSGSIATNSYYLIERAETSTSVTADLISSFSELSDTVEILSLIHNYTSTTLDSTPSVSAWSAGSITDNISMERIDFNILGATASNWGNNNTYTKNGIDIGGNAINGTPRSQNSINLKSIGYYQTPETSTYISGGYYIPTVDGFGFATYLSPAWANGIKRRGELYMGTIASSTNISSHLILNIEETKQGDVLTNRVQGQDYFVAIYKIRIGPNFSEDLAFFQSYFQTGANAPPHLDYGVLEWKYGVE